MNKAKEVLDLIEKLDFDALTKKVKELLAKNYTSEAIRRVLGIRDSEWNTLNTYLTKKGINIPST